jgi:glycosyltransferase involved in cell wall biosynthesis
MVVPKVSIVVPSYNHGRFLRQRMDSILRQTYQDFEVFVLDDASTDNTREVLAEYATRSRVELILRQKNGGSVFRQWNAGVALARGEYVWIAESDDYAEERFLEELTAVLDHNPGVGLVKCRSVIVDEEGRTTPDSREYPAERDWSRDFVLRGSEDCRLQLTHGNSITNASAVLFRRQLYMDVGWADESYRMCADWLQWSKMMLQADFAYVAKPLNYYRRHTNTVRQQCLGNVIHDLEDLRVCAYLLAHLPGSSDAAHEVCDRMTRRWVHHAIGRSRLRKSLTYDLQMLHLLRQLDHWYAATIIKHLARRVLHRCLGSRIDRPVSSSSTT